MSVIGECLVAFVFGSIVGLLVQRSRFCNTAALRDAMLFKTYRNTKLHQLSRFHILAPFPSSYSTTLIDL